MFTSVAASHAADSYFSSSHFHEDEDHQQHDSIVPLMHHHEEQHDLNDHLNHNANLMNDDDSLSLPSTTHHTNDEYSSTHSGTSSGRGSAASQEEFQFVPQQQQQHGQQEEYEFVIKQEQHTGDGFYSHNHQHNVPSSPLPSNNNDTFCSMDLDEGNVPQIGSMGVKYEHTQHLQSPQLVGSSLLYGQEFPASAVQLLPEPVMLKQQTPILPEIVTVKSEPIPASPSSIASQRPSRAAATKSALHNNSNSSGSGGSGACSEEDEQSGDDAPLAPQAATPRRGVTTASQHTPLVTQEKGKPGRKRKAPKSSTPKSSAAAVEAEANNGSSSDTETRDLCGISGVGLIEECTLPGYDAIGLPLTGDKRQQRLQRNRASAQLSRERKKQYITLLEKQLREMADVNDGLGKQVSELTKENLMLKSRLEKLQIREKVQGRFPGNNRVPLRTSPMSDGSLPTTPATTGSADPSGEIAYPHAKKLKVQAYDSPSTSSSNNTGNGSNGSSPVRSASGSSSSSSSSSAGFNARTGMLLFTLVMSVGLFSHMIGIDTIGNVPGGGNNVLPPSMLNRIEVLEESNSIVNVLAPSSLSLTTSSSQHGHGRVLQSIDSSPAVAASSSSTQQQDAFALVPVSVDTSSTSTSPVSVSRALAKPGVVVDEDESGDVLMKSTTHSVDHSSAAAALDIGMLSLLKRLYNEGNLSTSAAGQYFMDDSQVLYAPSAKLITKEIWEGLVANDSTSRSSSTSEPAEKHLALFDRPTAAAARRNGKRKHGSNIVKSPASKSDVQSRLRNRLPQLPSPDNAGTSTINIHDLISSTTDGSNTAGLNVGDKLLLWLPLNNGGSSSVLANSSNGASTASGVIEIACQIAHVRPIVVS